MPMKILHKTHPHVWFDLACHRRRRTRTRPTTTTTTTEPQRRRPDPAVDLHHDRPSVAIVHDGIGRIGCRATAPPPVSASSHNSNVPPSVMTSQVEGEVGADAGAQQPRRMSWIGIDYFQALRHHKTIAADDMRRIPANVNNILAIRYAPDGKQVRSSLPTLLGRPPPPTNVFRRWPCRPPTAAWASTASPTASACTLSTRRRPGRRPPPYGQSGAFVRGEAPVVIVAQVPRAPVVGRADRRPRRRLHERAHCRMELQDGGEGSPPGRAGQPGPGAGLQRGQHDVRHRRQR